MTNHADYFAVADPTDPTRITYWRRTNGRLNRIGGCGVSNVR